MEFEEEVFLWAMISRPEDTKKFASIFQPKWMHDPRYQKVLSEIYAFNLKHGTPPSISVLRKILEDQDPQNYEARNRAALDEIEQRNPDVSEIIYNLDKARDVAIIRSFQSLLQSPGTVQLQQLNKGTEMTQVVYKWLGQFIGMDTDITYDLKTAFDKLIQERGFETEDYRVPCGIDPIDLWTNGGLRPRNLGILLAPTGHGKSATLTVMAHKIASSEQKKVWFISNELPMNEISERFLCRVTGVPMTDIMNSPSVAYSGLERFWKGKLHERLMLTEINREVSMDDIEADMQKWTTLTGWKPDVLVLDFMERMKPNITGVDRSQSWNWLGAIAKDISRFAKKNNILVWTAAQTNREGMNAKEVLLSMGQGSTQHFQEAAVVVAMHQTADPESADKIALEFFCSKMRHSKKSAKTVKLKCDLSRMSISNEEITEKEQPTVNRGEGVDEYDKPRYKVSKRKKPRGDYSV